MNISLIKLIVMLSVFVGLVSGFLAAVPYIGGWIFCILICFSSVIVLGFMMWLHLLKLESVQESAVIGGIIGFVSYIAFSIVYMPLVLILLKLFKYYVNYGVALALNNAALWVIIFVSLSLAVLSGVLNAFTGFLTYYVSEFCKNIQNK